MAPATATHNIYLDKDGKVLEGDGGSVEGYRAAGVPGTVRGMELALKKYGSHRLTWTQLIEPARTLAANGFSVTYTPARSLRGRREYLSKYAETKRIYLNGGEFFNEGDLFLQPRPGPAFAPLPQRGTAEFYASQKARLCADDLSTHNGFMKRRTMRRVT